MFNQLFMDVIYICGYCHYNLLMNTVGYVELSLWNKDKTYRLKWPRDHFNNHFYQPSVTW